MKFHEVEVESDLNPDEVLCKYWASENDNYRVQQSLTSKLWLAFFRTNENENTFHLIGPPTKTRKDAYNMCIEHSIDLPW